jgi:mRNA interferase YafQ
MYHVHYTGQFKKDLKRIKKRSAKEFDQLREMSVLITSKGVKAVQRKYKPHILSGSYANHWECHVLPDLLLIWLQNDKENKVSFVRAGTHADLF